MERKDVRKSSGERNDHVVLEGNGREAELIVAGLKLLAAQIAMRDIIIDRGPGGWLYPQGGGRDQGKGVPINGEVDRLLEAIKKPNYITETTSLDPLEV
jgi:hypothetical protein